jgi:hypothetical protein
MRMAFRTGRGDFPVVAVFNAEFSVSLVLVFFIISFGDFALIQERWF